MQLGHRRVFAFAFAASLAFASLVMPSAQGRPSHYYSCTFNFTGGRRLPHPFCDPTLPLERRLDDLVSRMTIAEKCAALDTSNPAIPRLGVAR